MNKYALLLIGLLFVAGLSYGGIGVSGGGSASSSSSSLTNGQVQASNLAAGVLGGVAYLASNQTFTGVQAFNNVAAFPGGMTLSNVFYSSSSASIQGSVQFSSNNAWTIIGVGNTLRIGDSGFTQNKTVLMLNDVSQIFSICASNGVYLYNAEFGTPGGSFPPLFFGTNVSLRATNGQLNATAPAGFRVGGAQALYPVVVTNTDIRATTPTVQMQAVYDAASNTLFVAEGLTTNDWIKFVGAAVP